MFLKGGKQKFVRKHVLLSVTLNSTATFGLSSYEHKHEGTFVYKILFLMPFPRMGVCLFHVENGHD